MSITIELLDSMLAPSPGNPAEAHYRTIPLDSRVRELTTLLTQLHGENAANAGRCMLAAVLLRREVETLAGKQQLTGLAPSSAVSLMGEIANPLMSLFLQNEVTQSRRQIGHIIAELSSSLSLVSVEDGKEWMKTVLNYIRPGCGNMDPMTFQLLGDIADRSPLTLWSVGSAELEASMGALLQVGIAHEKAQRIMSSSSSKDQMEQALMAQFDEKSTTVDASSPSAIIGKHFLPTMLEALTIFGNSLSSNQVDVMSSCMSHLSTCSIQCPSMMAGDDTSLTCLLRTCMKFAQINSQGDEDITFLKLSALDVLATITSVPQIKRLILKPIGTSPRCVMQGGGSEKSPLLKFLIQGNDDVDQKGVLYVCAELAITGVDQDEENWSEDPASVYDTESSWEDDHTALYAESLLETFVENLGGASTLQSIFQLVDILLASPSWQNQRAVLSILERCLAAAPATFVPHVGSTVDVALRLIQSSSKRVQYQALQLLGALCCANTVESDEQPAATQPILVRENYGDKILEAIAHLIQSPCTKVASHACLTVVSYCRGGNGQGDCMIPIEKDLIVPFVGSLLEALKLPLSVDMSQQGVSEGSLTVLIRAIGATACLADASGEAFLPHYGIMGGLTATMKACPNVRTHEMAMLRGAAIEAASIVGQAVAGPDGEQVSLYANDASEIMEFATSLLSSGQTDVVPIDQLFAACARIAAVMGSQYVPFMPSILPHILKRATEKLEVSITDSEDSSNKSNEDDDGGYSINIPGMGLKKIKISTTQLEEKANSARAIYEHARSLGKDFGPYAEASADAFLPLLHNEYSGDVRSTSAQALCQIFKAACLSASAGSVAQALPQNLLPVLAKALAKQLSQESDEDELEIRFAIADALSEVMYDAFTHKDANGVRVAQISVLDAREIVGHVMILIAGCLTRRSKLIAEMTTDVVDNDELARCDEKLHSEQELLTHLVDSVGYQLKSLGASFIPIFSQLVAKPLGKLLTSTGTRDGRARLSATCLFDDCVEHCGPQAASTYAPQLLQGVVESLNDPESDAELIQAAVYGLAQISRNAPNALSARLGQDLLMKIYNLCSNTSKSEADDSALFENAVSCMGSLALFKGAPLFDSIPDKGTLSKSFLAGLPLEEDFDEAKVCHDGLCDMVDMGLVDIKAEYNDLLRIIGDILSFVAEGDEVASESTCARLLGIIDQIQQTVDANTIQAAFARLDPNAQQALVSAMQ
eukprot:scaffold23596_cov208-Skeletonema_marinoi.AAC.4